MAGINQLESLKVFKAVVECGSFTAAARRLDVSAAWVSKSVERLEAQFGTTLFTRSTRHMQITDNGERCYARSLELLDQWQALEADLQHSDETPKGKLRISAPMTWGLAKMGGLITEFMAKYPDILLDVQLGDQHVNVMEEQFDLVLRLTNQLSDSSLLCRKITSYRRVACASPAYLAQYGEPQHPEDLSRHACLMYNFPGTSRRWRFTTGRKSMDIFLEPKLVANNSKLLQSALLAGQGIALMPDFIITDDLASGRLVPILQGFETTDLNLYSLRPGNRSTSHRLKLLHDFLCEAVGRDSKPR